MMAFKLLKYKLAILTFRGTRTVICSYSETNKMHYFTNLFWYRTLRVSDRFTVHHQESSAVYTALGICHTGYADCQHNLYDRSLLLYTQH